MKVKSRIGILDGFRAIAILVVMLYHFFSRWTPPHSSTSLYPYKGEYDYFKYGILGVKFFFIISGFVIFFTLDNTTKMATFWKKRLIRLLPAIVIATLLTFTVFTLFDTHYLFPNSHKLQNFIPSLTFIKPEFFNKFPQFFKTNFDYINGSYWSLWPEIQFYLFSSVLFYLNRKHFVRNFVLCTIGWICLNELMINIQGSNKLHVQLPAGVMEAYSTWFQNIFNLVSYLIFFGIGVLFYILFKSKQQQTSVTPFVKVSLVVFLLYAIYSHRQLEVGFILGLMFVLFFAFIYFPDKLSLFENKTLTSIGVSSYFLYLIHENIGVFLINRLGSFYLPLGFVFSLLMMWALILLSQWYTLKIDNKLNKTLKNLVLTKP